MSSDTKSSGNDDAPLLLREVVYEKLKDEIRHGELHPGEPLSESRISRRLDISRTPVREALQRLAQEGLVRNVPGQGVTVAAPTIQEVFDVIHIRSLLAPELARLAARSMSEEVLEELIAAVEQMETAVEESDREAWSKADTRFHELLSHSSRNKLLGQLSLQMRNRIHHLTADTQTSAGRLANCTAEHRAVVDAIKVGDEEAARQAMVDHIGELRESLYQQLAYS
jgi:DNA-binding GntR family transcriptional regulator